MIAALSVLFPSVAATQSEQALRRAFEGKTVVLEMDMPGTSDGVEIKVDSDTPVDYGKLADQIKRYGVAIHSGESVMVTKVRAKKHHIEFQLGGGGYGTFSDVMASGMSNPSPAYYNQGKSKREKDIERALKYEQDKEKRRELKEELDDLRRERRRDNAWSSSLAAQAAAQQKQDERALRAQGGSRFNIRYHEKLTADELTPESVMQALARYVDFAAAHRESVPPPAAKADHEEHSTMGTLRKGLTLEQVERLLGPARTANTRRQGSIDTMERSYAHEGELVDATFVGGILVDYTVRPE
jgi:hypothetical protein